MKLPAYPLAQFAFAMAGFCALLWAAQFAPPSSQAASIVLVGLALGGVLAVKPGWNLRPLRPTGYWATLAGLLVVSAVLAAWTLRRLEIPLPYDQSHQDVLALLPGIALVAGIEELLFRQIAFRWLERHGVAGRTAVVATALAFGCAHLGPVWRVGPAERVFYLLQSSYLLWVGGLLGEIRRVSGAWSVSWGAHLGYNATVLWALSVSR